jgi:hypothetical protein
LLNVVLHDHLPEETASRPVELDGQHTPRVRARRAKAL